MWQLRLQEQVVLETLEEGQSLLRASLGPPDPRDCLFYWESGALRSGQGQGDRSLPPHGKNVGDAQPC